MSLSDRRLFLTSLLALGACGFTPVYGPGGAAQGLTGAIEVQAPNERDEYELVKRLEERLGQPNGARFTLGYRIETREEASGITAGAETTRKQLFGTVTFTLTASATGQVVQSGSVTSFVSYSQQGTTVSTARGERDAHYRLMVALADLLTTRLIAGAPDWLG
ncbi:MAG TPA: hypothetical protein ENK63_05070 [Rhodobacterales bacterium]|nr:hypothetical protein [Rhodobacterales bacterium]